MLVVWFYQTPTALRNDQQRDLYARLTARVHTSPINDAFVYAMTNKSE